MGLTRRFLVPLVLAPRSSAASLGGGWSRAVPSRQALRRAPDDPLLLTFGCAVLVEGRSAHLGHARGSPSILAAMAGVTSPRLHLHFRRTARAIQFALTPSCSSGLWLFRSSYEAQHLARHRPLSAIPGMVRARASTSGRICFLVFRQRHLLAGLPASMAGPHARHRTRDGVTSSSSRSSWSWFASMGRLLARDLGLTDRPDREGAHFLRAPAWPEIIVFIFRRCAAVLPSGPPRRDRLME